MAWRAETLPWIALGVFATLTTCSAFNNPENNASRRNFYASREQCLQDYTDAQCRSSGSGAHAYVGPYYYGARQTANDPGPGRTAVNGESATASRVVRGGFGTTARSGHGGYHGG